MSRMFRRRRGAWALAEEQAALRRVATLVARGDGPQEVLAAAAREIRDLLHTDITLIARFEADATATIVAETGGTVGPSERWELDPGLGMGQVFRTGKSARIDEYGEVSEWARARFDERGVRAAVACPLVVGGRLWGAIVAQSRTGKFPADTELRLGELAELFAIAIANADGRAQLNASRARIVAAGDEARRRLERDLHDGIQQRLVSLALTLRRAEKSAPPVVGDVLSQAVSQLDDATEELRKIARGIHPAILSQGGLGPALRGLARRSPVPATVTIRADGRLPEPVEVAAYYVVAEALTNAARHAAASQIRVEVSKNGDALRLCVSDDGVGGADPAHGSGLTGLSDRVEALGGIMSVKSPRGGGTSIDVMLPSGQPDP